MHLSVAAIYLCRKRTPAAAERPNGLAQRKMPQDSSRKVKTKSLQTGSQKLTSNLLRPGLPAFALAHDGGSKAGAEIVGQFVQLRIAVNLDSFFGCIANNVAVVAPSQVVFQLCTGPGVDDAV